MPSALSPCCSFRNPSAPMDTNCSVGRDGGGRGRLQLCRWGAGGKGKEGMAHSRGFDPTGSLACTE